jgi:hypothetical protein
MNSRPVLASSWVNDLMSAPAQNTCGFADAMTSARTVPPSRTCSQTRRRSSTTFGESAFIGGLSSHAIAISPRVSSVTVSPCSKPSLSGRLYAKKPWPLFRPVRPWPARRRSSSGGA